MTKFDEHILKSIKIGSYLTLIAPLLVFTSLMYPFVTSKVFFFRILIEILFFLYLYIALKYKEYRPRLSGLLICLSVYSLVLLLSGIFGVDWNLSFWGDFERLGGIFSWLHFVAYFVILVSVFRTDKDWRRFIIVSVTVGAIMTIHGLAQRFGWWGTTNAGRIDSYTGNPSYLASFLIFNIFFCFYLFLRVSNLYWRSALAILAGLECLALFYTGTRGAYLGMAVGVLLFAILNVIFSPNRRRTIILGGGMILFFAIYLLMFLNSASILKKIPSQQLTRVLSISMTDPTVSTRFISWNAAWKGFLEHPVLGVGPENFAIIFDKYISPSFYTFSPSQTYFDRAHNVVLDLLATSGIVGLISYLAIFVAALVYLSASYKKKKISLPIFSGVVALLAAYFIQNIFVFDSINSFIPFILILGFTQFLYFSDEKIILNPESRKINPMFLIFSFLFFLFLIYFYNIKPILAIREVRIAEYFVQKEHDLSECAVRYQRALSYDTPLDRDIRTQMAVAVSTNIAKYGGGELPRETINDIFDFSIGEMKKNLKYNSRDSYFNLKLGELYNLWSDYNKKDPDEAEYYLNKAIESSPGRLPEYYVLSQSKLLRKDYDGAIKIMLNAVEMNPTLSFSYWHLARAYFVAERDEEAMKALKAALLLGYAINDTKDIEEFIARFFKEGDYRLIINLLRQAVNLNPKEAKYYGRLAMAYAAIDDKEKARQYMQETVKLDKQYEAAAKLFFEKLEKGELCEVCKEKK
ncbi:MAG: O-antigen ligase family protein [Patescibacteria group bacterium]|nr:O-antigen ligase family protein [Patescibacteria group bacterium]